MMNKVFAFASHLRDVRLVAAANVLALCGGWYSVVIVVLKSLRTRDRIVVSE